MDYSFTLAQLRSDVVFVLFQTRVDNREIAEWPLVEKAGNINIDTMVEGCFLHLFFTFLNFHLWAVIETDTDTSS